ncbi:MAG: bifunctional demethylmenaquinone methyltransferase/2-methoxy-6-polyprenyl-1,4-benzoquinol methylase UbiE [Magnetospiraceae bacterium]
MNEKTKAADGASPDRTHFGFRDVDVREKASLVRDVFDNVATRYDLMNDLMSGGIHRLWKDRFVSMLTPRAGRYYLDVGGGTGDIAFRILDRIGPARRGGGVTVCDINDSMLSVGRDRALDKGITQGLSWVCGDAEALPVADGSVHGFTIAFCIRNVTHIDKALEEAYRVLRPGGRFLCLEFSEVVLPMLDRLYDTYSFNILPLIGQVVARDRDSYQYLAESIRKFPPQDDFAAMIEDAGFEKVTYQNLSGGIAAIHSGWRM